MHAHCTCIKSNEPFILEIMLTLIHCFLFSPDDLGPLVDQMVGYKLVTKQTPKDGVQVTKVS